MPILHPSLRHYGSQQDCECGSGGYPHTSAVVGHTFEPYGIAFPDMFLYPRVVVWAVKVVAYSLLYRLCVPDSRESGSGYGRFEFKSPTGDILIEPFLEGLSVVFGGEYGCDERVVVGFLEGI